MNGAEKKFIDMQNFFFTMKTGHILPVVFCGTGENIRPWKLQIG